MNYEAKIRDLWYPVELIQEYTKGGVAVVDVWVLSYKAWNGTKMIPTSRARTVLPKNIRPTIDDPLETVYPKEK